MLFSIGEIQDAIENYEGFCIECGELHDNVEPDARKYKCENCGKKSVYGAEEIILMGLIKNE